MAASAGTHDASSHPPKSICTPSFSAMDAPMGFAEVAVSHSADDTARLAIPQNMRKPPVRLRAGSEGVDPALSAIESTTGKRTPDRAVLLGKAGAMRASVKKML